MSHPYPVLDIGNTGKICLANDNAITLHCLEQGRLNWDDRFASLPEVQSLKPGSVVIDAGAFIGDTTEEFLQRGCVVHAFEPRRDSFYCLQYNCPAAHCVMSALGTGQPYFCATDGGNIGGKPIIIDHLQPQRAIRLDECGFDALHLLKIDCEGFEPYVLDGASATLQRFRPIVHVEINHEALAGFGFTEDDVRSRLPGYAFRKAYDCNDHLFDLIATPI